MTLKNRDGRVWLTLACVQLAAALTSAMGCGGDSKLGRVDGIVRVGGKPLTSGKVVFQPAAGRGAMGQIGADGTFTLGTFGESDGALLGAHKVAIIAYEGATQGRPDPTAQRTSAKPAVPAKYLALGTSDLTYEVKPGTNHPEFDLERP